MEGPDWSSGKAPRLNIYARTKDNEPVHVVLPAASELKSKRVVEELVRKALLRDLVWNPSGLEWSIWGSLADNKIQVRIEEIAVAFSGSAGSDSDNCCLLPHERYVNLGDTRLGIRVASVEVTGGKTGGKIGIKIVLRRVGGDYVLPKIASPPVLQVQTGAGVWQGDSMGSYPGKYRMVFGDHQVQYDMYFTSRSELPALAAHPYRHLFDLSLYKTNYKTETIQFEVCFPQEEQATTRCTFSKSSFGCGRLVDFPFAMAAAPLCVQHRVRISQVQTEIGERFALSTAHFLGDRDAPQAFGALTPGVSGWSVKLDPTSQALKHVKVSRVPAIVLVYVSKTWDCDNLWTLAIQHEQRLQRLGVPAEGEVQTAALVVAHSGKPCSALGDWVNAYRNRILLIASIGEEGEPWVDGAVDTSLQRTVTRGIEELSRTWRASISLPSSPDLR